MKPPSMLILNQIAEMRFMIFTLEHSENLPPGALFGLSLRDATN